MKLVYSPHKYSQQRQRQKATWVYPVLMAMEAQFHREKGRDVYWCRNPLHGDKKIITEPEGLPFLNLPYPDRKFTNAFAKMYQQYGNYKYHPATHMQVANGCWWGVCKFCVEQKNKWEVRNIEHVFEEIDNCAMLGFKEIFDDSGTFPTGKWLEQFCYKAITRNYKMTYGCNMRIAQDVDFKLMKQAGFRMLLFGIESANQRTLNRIRKGIKNHEIIPILKRAARAGLEPHIAVMFGYPWESEKEELETLKLVHYCLRKGLAKTAQASLYDIQGIRSVDRGNIKRIYDAAYNLEFWIRRLGSIRNVDDIKYLWKCIKKGIKRD